MTSRLKSAPSVRSGTSATMTRMAATKILPVVFLMVGSLLREVPLFSRVLADAAWTTKARLIFANSDKGAHGRVRVKACRKAEYISGGVAAGRAEGMMNAE